MTKFDKFMFAFVVIACLLSMGCTEMPRRQTWSEWEKSLEVER